MLSLSICQFRLRFDGRDEPHLEVVRGHSVYGKGYVTPKLSSSKGWLEPLAMSLVVLFALPPHGNGCTWKTGVGTYSGIKGLPSPLAGPAPTRAVDERRLCPFSRPPAANCHQRASCMGDVISIFAR